MKKLLAVIVLVLASTAAAFAQGGTLTPSGAVLSGAGRPIAGATVAICTQNATIGNSTTPCSPLATIYTNSTLTTVATNPFQTDGMGNYLVWAVPGIYQVQIYGPSVITSMSPVSVACVPGATGSCGGGSGGLPVGNVNDIQDKASNTGFGASHINDNLSFGVLNMNENTAFVGPRPYFDITNPEFGAVGDGAALNTQTGSITSGTNTFTVSTTPATGWHPGMGIEIYGAGTGGGSLIAKIYSISGDVFTLVNNSGSPVNAVNTVSGAVFGDDDTLAIQAAIAAACATPTNSGGAAVFFPPGNYAFTVSQNSSPTFTACAGLYLFGGNSSEHNGGQFIRPPSATLLAQTGSLPGTGPTLSSSYPANEVTIANLAIQGYNTAFYSQGASDITLDNDTFSVTNTGLSGNAAVHLSNLYWARILGGSMQTNSGSHPYPPGLLLTGDTCAGCTATVINFRMQDTRMVGGNIQYIQNGVINASQPGYWEIDNVDTESQDSDYLSITNSSGSAFQFGPIKISRAGVSDESTTTGAIINFHGAASTDLLSGVTIDHDVSASIGYSGAAVVMTEGTLTGYQAIGCGEGIGCATLAENSSGAIVGTGFLTNQQGIDYFTNTADTLRSTTNPFSPNSVDGPSIRITQNSNQLASVGLDGKNGLMFSDGATQGWLSDLQASSAGNIDVAFPQNYPPTSLGGTPSSTGGTIAAGTYYVYAASDTQAGDNCATNSYLSAISNIAGPFVLTGSTSSIAMTWTAATTGLTANNGYCLFLNGSNQESKFATRINSTGFVSGAGATSVTITTSAASTGVFPVSQMVAVEHFTPSGTSTPGINNIIYVDGTRYACSSAGLNAAITAAEVSGIPGEVDARGCGGTISSTVTVGTGNTPVTLILDRSTNWNCTITNGTDCFDVTQNGSGIIFPGETVVPGPTGGITVSNTANVAHVVQVLSSGSNAGYTIEGMTIHGNSSATVTGGGVFTIVNGLQIGTVRGLALSGGFTNTVLYQITQTAGNPVGPINQYNNYADCLGVTGCIPYQLKAVAGGGVMLGINNYGGSFAHPGPGGLPVIDLEGITGQDCDGVNFYGTQLESINTTDIGFKINNCSDVTISSPTFTDHTNIGATAVEITGTGSNVNGIVIDNLTNFDDWTDTLVNTINSITVSAATQPRITHYTYNSAGQTETNIWDDQNGNIATIDKNGLSARSITIPGTSNGCADFTSGVLGSTGSGCGSGGSGTVTSVGLSTPSWLSVSGSPVTTSGTLAVTATGSETQNEFLATPNGSSGPVGLRAIVAADVPTLNQNTTGTAANLSGTPALPNGTTATTQSVADNTTKLATDAFVIANAAGSGTVNSGTKYAFGEYAAAGTAISSGPTPPTTDGTYDCGYTITGAAAAAPTCPQVGLGARAVTGTTATDTILYSDNSSNVEYQGSVAVAVTLPTATTLGNTHFVARFVNTTSGSATAVTVTPTTWTVNGSATLAIAQGQQCTFTVDASGTNWDAACSDLPMVAGTNITITRGQYGPTIAATGTQTIASGTAALGTSAIASAACASAVTVSASGVATTDVVTASFNGNPTAVTGYIPATTGMLTIISYPTSGDVNFLVCNNTSASITPGGITLNWRVVR